MSTHPGVENYGWTVPVGDQRSHYVLAARLVGRSGWLGKTACGEESGGNTPLRMAPVKRACPICTTKVGIKVGG